MGTLQIGQSSIWGVMLVLLVAVAILAAESPAVHWNEKAQSQILNQSELDKLARNDSKFRPQQIRQITWPTAADVASKSVAANDALREGCVGWLRKFMTEEYLPSDLPKNLVAMRDSVSLQKGSEPRRLDVFMARFRKDPYVIHIYETPGSAVVAVADERLTDKPRTDHRDWVLEVAGLVLNKALKPEPDFNDVHVSESMSEGCKVSRISWLIASCTVREGTRRSTSGVKAAQVGASDVRAETDGRFIVFTILKEFGGPTRPDPYTPRF